MRILTWNVNHRAYRRKVPSWVAPCIVGKSPDIVVLTEYVEGDDHLALTSALKCAELPYVMTSPRTSGENQILIAARSRIHLGLWKAPPIHVSVPGNVLHISSEIDDLNVLGFRMPVGGDFGVQLRRMTWNWLVEAADQLRDSAAIILGDFNTSPTDRVPPSDNVFQRLLDNGWSHAQPPTGFSFRHSSGAERNIDHCFVSRKLKILQAEFSWDFQAHYELTAATIVAPGVPDHAMLVVDIDTGFR